MVQIVIVFEDTEMIDGILFSIGTAASLAGATMQG